jgi:hypothetical protein
LSLQFGAYIPALGTKFIILNNDGSDPIVGTFSGIPEGSRFTIAGQLFSISYLGLNGTGNDVVISRVRPLAALGSVQINGTTAPSPTFNHSRITSLVLTFNTPVTIQSGAFSISNGLFTLTNSLNGGILVTGEGTTTITLTFDANVFGVEYGSLSDGIWTLTTDLTKVLNDDNTSGVGGIDTGDIRRLFGDINGDNSVDGSDFAEFGNCWGDQAFWASTCNLGWADALFGENAVRSWRNRRFSLGCNSGSGDWGCRGSSGSARHASGVDFRNDRSYGDDLFFGNDNLDDAGHRGEHFQRRFV